MDPLAAVEHALTLIASPHEDPEVRANAAAILARVPTVQALNALIEALAESPLLGYAALEALEQHTESFAIDRMQRELRRIVNEIADHDLDIEITAYQRRRLRAVIGLMSLVARRSFQQVEVELFTWWRTHPNVRIQCCAAGALLLGGVENASTVVAEGIPGANEGTPSETGELDGPARELIPSAAMVVLRGPAPEAFERLSAYCQADSLVGWFGKKRAEVILLLLLGQLGHNLLGQLGHNPTSWLSGWCDELSRSGIRPDQRWEGIARAMPSSSPLRILAERLSSALLAR